MDHVFTVECQRFVPNPYTLVHVAAARARALRRGAPPRLETEGHSLGYAALREIAAGAFTSDELSTLLLPSPELEDRPDAIEATESELLIYGRTVAFDRPAGFAGKETITQEWVS
jgi:DNA-directed RNA polymerase subunit omega